MKEYNKTLSFNLKVKLKHQNKDQTFLKQKKINCL